MSDQYRYILMSLFQVSFTERRSSANVAIDVVSRDFSDDVQQVVPETGFSINGKLATGFEPSAAKFDVLVIVLRVEFGNSWP